MPQGANVVIKKNDDTTDVTWTYQQPSAGESQPAIWMGPTPVGNAFEHAPQLRMSARDGSSGKTRVVRFTYSYPDVQGASAPYAVGTPARALVEFTLPKSMPTDTLREAVSQLINLLDSTVIKDGIKAGYATS